MGKWICYAKRQRAAPSPACVRRRTAWSGASQASSQALQVYGLNITSAHGHFLANIDDPRFTKSRSRKRWSSFAQAAGSEVSLPLHAFPVFVFVLETWAHRVLSSPSGVWTRNDRDRDAPNILTQNCLQDQFGGFKLATIATLQARWERVYAHPHCQHSRKGQSQCWNIRRPSVPLVLCWLA